MKKQITTLFFFILCLNGISQNIHMIDSVFSRMYNQGEFNGNIIVSKSGNILLKKSYGYSNIKTQEPLSDSSIFTLASITKQFTAAAIVLLNRENKLSYEDDIRTYIPELDFYPKITIKNLLTHTSGLYSYMDLTDSLVLRTDKDSLLNNDNVIALYKKNQPKLNFLPNSKYEYSNVGYLLLATIVERVSKQSFSDFLEGNIFYPLKMNATKILFRYAEDIENTNLTDGYQENESGEIVDAIMATPAILNFDLVKGPGRLYSTVIDLNTWSNALSNNFFTEPEWNLIGEIGLTDNKEQRNYGFGWFVTQDIINGKSLYHSGSWPGYITYIEKNVEKDITIIILQNVSTSKSHLPTFALRNLLYNSTELKLENKYLKSLAGNYITASGKIKIIAFENDKLYVVMNPSFKMELIPRSKTIFKVNEFDPEVNFEFIIENEEVKAYNFYQLNLGKKATVTKRE